MSQNQSYWDYYSTPATENSTMAQVDFNSGPPYWLDEVLGVLGAAVLAIPFIIYGIKNPDKAQRLLEFVMDFFSMAMERIRNRGRATPPPVPPRNGVPRNFTDDTLIEMRGRPNQGQAVYDAPTSVWI